MYGQPGAQSLQVLAADQLRVIGPVPTGSAPRSVEELVTHPDEQHGHGRIRIDTDHGGAHLAAASLE
jgi:hypothetical protein